MWRWLTVGTLVQLILIPSGFALGRANNPNVVLEFSPQRHVGVSLNPRAAEMLDYAVAIHFEDHRKGDPTVIGTRTDDDNEVFDLRAVNDVIEYLNGTVTELIQGRSIAVDPNGRRRLTIEVHEFVLSEVNQAVGAEYSSRVKLVAQLHDDGGNKLWSGEGKGVVFGDGRKFKNEIVNAYLSDALFQAVASVMNDHALQMSWAKGKAWRVNESGTDFVVAGTMSPPELLAQVLALVEADLGTEILLEFVGQEKLSRKMSAADLIEWKQARVPEPVIEAAMRLPVE